MIKSFGDDVTADFASGKRSARALRIPADIRSAAIRKLVMIETAEKLSDLSAPPGNRLEALKGNLAAFHSIRINQQWRVIFRWTDSGAEDVQIVDYH